MTGAGAKTRPTCRGKVLQKPEELDLQPGTGHLVVQVIGRVLAVNDDALETSGSLGIGALVLLEVVLGEGHDERGDREGHAQVDVVHEVDDALGPLGGDNVRVLPVEPEQGQGRFFLDKGFRGAVRRE